MAPGASSGAKNLKKIGVSSFFSALTPFTESSLGVYETFALNPKKRKMKGETAHP